MIYLIYQFVLEVDSNLKYMILYYYNIVNVYACVVVEVGGYTPPLILSKIIHPLITIYTIT